MLHFHFSRPFAPTLDLRYSGATLASPGKVGIPVAAPSLTSPSYSASRRSLNVKYVLFALLAFTVLVTILTRDLSLLDPASPLRQRYARVPLLILLHGVPGALALFLGVFQFSTRLRSRYLDVHRWMGRIYVGATFIAAPVSIPVAIFLGDGSLIWASIVQAVGWLFCTGVALYCVRHGNIRQHRLWMMRGYPFAAVFAINRALLAIPAIQRAGQVGLDSVVWSVIMLAGFVPSVVIAWQETFAPKPRVAAAKAAD